MLATWRWTLLALVVVLLGLVGLGYLSNAVSASFCEEQTKGWMEERLAQTPQIMPGRAARSEPAEFSFPWVVGVRYWRAVSMKGGEGGTRFYISFFGLAVPVRNRVEMMS